MILQCVRSSSTMFQTAWKLVFLSFLLLCIAGKVQGQNGTSNITGYSCSDGPAPCHTYAFYKAQPNYTDLADIANLFSTQTFNITTANDLPGDTVSVAKGHALLIPITCDCMGSYSQANISYQILAGDTFWKVSTLNFEYLTTYQAVEIANPTLVPENLTIDTIVVFPIRCQCPSKAQISKGIKMQITYVVQKADTSDSVSKKFGADLADLKSQNGITSKLIPNDTLLVPVSAKPTLAQSPTPAPSPSSNTNNSSPVPESSSSGGSNNGVVIGASIGGAVALLVILVLVFWVLRKRRHSYGLTRTSEDPKRSSDLRVGSFERKKTRHDELLADVTSTIGKPHIFSAENIQKATQNFSPLCNIEGSVYKGILDGKVYAIKQMKGEVSEELKILQKVNHSNLVRLEGFCISSEGQSCLVYEYAENGSLNCWLHDPESIPKQAASTLSSTSLSWKIRLQIALDIANGLQYIHEHTTPSVVHKDVKSSNILLDGNFRAKIANFGMAKSGINVLTRHIVGTQGYMAPEYLADGLVTPKLDVFAFGVVLLELISGKEAIVREGGVPLAGKAGLLWTQIKPLMEGEHREVELKKWIDPNLTGVCPDDSVLCLAMIAKACVDDDPGARPSLPEIVYKLSKALEALMEHSDESFEAPIQVIAR
ncbi:serine/threonine receptor-like kinase NFP isoform X1 [Cryptomeria japonica]|uniref:serine/threonine receptor-like kinase NFP isoform X1 n=2 Tax=Cryptomeria japonica TaxID=3369 RepID=UPI0025AD6822|nr:serine/threonine receptor-like kinase NFP isoform X1 [Cryptomeria japonica]